MNASDFDKILLTELDNIKNLLASKGEDYSSLEDRFSNFKRLATLLNTTPFTVLSVFMLKHVDSVCQAISKNPDNPSTITEPIEGRIRDIMAYCVLLIGLIEDAKNGQKSS